MRAWDETEAAIRRAQERRAASHAETLAELEEEGIALDPPAPGHHRHGDVEHESDHAHPHAHTGPGERPVTGIVGAGAVGLALGVALHRAGWPVAAVASRDPASRERFREHVPEVRAFAEAEALLDDVELVMGQMTAHGRLYGRVERRQLLRWSHVIGFGFALGEKGLMRVTENDLCYSQWFFISTH